MKRPLLLAAMLVAGAVVAQAASDITISAPDGVGDVVALTNALKNISSYRNVLLEPGVYDLKDVAMESGSHLSLTSGGHAIVGLGATRDETILLGGGKDKGKRILLLNGSSASSLAVVTNLTLTGGYTSVNGGAFCGNNFAHAYDCVISNNYAGGSWQEGGGAIEFGFARGCYFENNRTDGANGHFGGAMWCNDATYQGAVDCVFTNNYAHAGGAFRGSGKVLRCTFVGNYSTGDGGAVASSSDVRDCTFVKNSGYAGGGASGCSVISNCVFTDNVARAPYRENGGGALFYSGGGTIMDCAFTNNTCSGYAGTVNLYKKEGTVSPTCFIDCDFFGGVAGYYGGAIYQSGATRVEITRCHFTSNVAQTVLSYAGSGGAVNMTDGFVADSTFEGNEAQNNDGGGLYAGSSVALSNCTFTANKAKKDGGGAYFAGTDCYKCTFIGNEAGSDGAAVRGSGSANLDVCGCHFVSNVVASVPYKNLTFRDCVISNHHVKSWIFRDCNFYGSLVADNRSTYSAGGVSVDSVSTALAYTNANSVFKGNYQYINAITEAKVIINCTYAENTSMSGAYGDIVRAEALAYNTVFVNNDYNGTLRDFRSGSYPTMTNCTYSYIQDAALPAKCSGCFRATKGQLRLWGERKAESPYMPRTVSPRADAFEIGECFPKAKRRNGRNASSLMCKCANVQAGSFHW